MDKKFIKVLIEDGVPLRELKQEDALKRLNNDIMTVYVMNGLHRSMQPDAFREEVRVCAVAMYNEFINDPLYKSVRDKEIPYIFSNGMKGRLGTDKDIVITCKSLLRWVEGYVNHQERRLAFKQLYDERMPKPPQLPPREPTDEELRQNVVDAWNEYVDYREKVSTENRTGSRESVKSIGEVIGVPVSCLDFGRFRIDYLRRRGYVKENEKLIDVFRRLYDGGRKLDLGQ